MAGKLHYDYQAYAASSNTRMAISPFGKLARAYAEGYAIQRAGGTLVNNGDPEVFGAQTRGFNDSLNGRPPTHVG